MKIFMIGEAAKHMDTLRTALAAPVETIALPREAAYEDSHDRNIGPDDVVISLKFQRSGTAPAFRLLHVPGAGLDQINFDVLPPECLVANVFEHEIPIAEYVLASLLNWEIGIDEMRAGFTPERWSDIYRDRKPHGEIFGKTLGLLGYGRIGRAIASRARVFGMRVIAMDPALPRDEDSVDRVLYPDELGEILGEADFVVVACPLNRFTKDMIGEAELRQMKPEAVFVNISRAEVANEESLYKALSEGWIAGAVLDVWYRYPANAGEQVEPSRFAFADLPNVVATPHSSAWTKNLPHRRYTQIAKNINRLLAGEPLMNEIER